MNKPPSGDVMNWWCENIGEYESGRNESAHDFYRYVHPEWSQDQKSLQWTMVSHEVHNNWDRFGEWYTRYRVGARHGKA